MKSIVLIVTIYTKYKMCKNKTGNIVEIFNNRGSQSFFIGRVNNPHSTSNTQ